MRFPTPNKKLTLAAACLLTFGFAPFAHAAATTREPFSGIQYTLRTQTLPRPLRIHIYEIDPTKAGIQFRTTPSNGATAGENSPQTTKAYVAASRAQVGVNASFFFSGASGGFDNRGLIASQGDVYSPFGENADNSRPWPVFHITAANVASILSRATPYAANTNVTPATTLYNGVSGSERIVTAGANTAGAVAYGEPTLLHPRTAAGITAAGKVIMMVVDGRQTGISEGMTSLETADLLIQLGVVDAVNFDGGGSSSFVVADPVSRTLNSPSDGTDRSVSVSLVAFGAAATFAQDRIAFSDFYAGDRGTFAYAPSVSGSTQGILTTSTNVAVQSSGAFRNGWYQRLTINDDPAVSTVSENPTGGWFVRHISGSSASPAQNIARPTKGYVGFWARTSVSGISAALVVDAPSLDRGIKRTLTADGQWHLYEWNLNDAAQWGGWAGGDGVIAGTTFTLDSIQLFGPNANAVVDLDEVSHNTYGSLAAAAGPNFAKQTVPAAQVTASLTDSGTAAGDTVDGSLTTRWAGTGDGQWIRYDLGANKTIGYVKLGWYQGNTRVSTFDVQVSTNGTSWTNVLTGAKSTGFTTALETYELTDVVARYVRIVGHGNTVNTVNSLTEVEIWGF